MFNRILIICVGNICRSPMAEGLLKNTLAKYNSTIQVSSAGLSALIDKPAAPISQSLLLKRDIDISSHRARQLSEQMILDANLILTMETFHQKAIEKSYPFACGKVFLLGRWSHFEVPDPYGGLITDYENALNLIEKGLSDWHPKICGKR